MKSPTKKVPMIRAAAVLVDQLMAITGWKVSEIYANEGDKEPCGLLIGDEDFFTLLTEEET